MSAMDDLSQLLAQCDTIEEKRAFLQGVIASLEQAHAGAVYRLRPQLQHARVQQAVRAWLAGQDSAAPPLRPAQRTEVARLVETLQIHECRYDEPGVSGGALHTHCGFSLGGWRTVTQWRYCFAREQNDLHTEGVQWNAFLDAITHYPFIESAVFSAISTTLSPKPLGYLIYLCGFDRLSDARPSWAIQENHIFINQEDADELAAGLGIRRKLAEAVVAARPFVDMADLGRVPGIGPKTILDWTLREDIIINGEIAF